MRNIYTCIFLLLVLLIVACDQITNVLGDRSPQSKKEIERATALLANNPTALITYTDSIIHHVIYTQKTIPYWIKVYELRQKAFADLQQMDSVVTSGEMIRSLASQHSDSLAMANSLLLVKGDIDYASQKKMIPFLPGAIYTFSKLGMQYEEAKLCATYGVILIPSGDFKLAQTYLLRAYDKMERLDSTKNLFNISLNLGSNYQQLKDNVLALKYYKKALHFAGIRKDSLLITSALMNIGVYYHENEKKEDSAMHYLQLAKALLPQRSPYYFVMKLDYNIALQELNNKRYKESEDIFNRMYDNCLQNNLTEGCARALNGLVNVYVAAGRMPNAIAAAKQAMDMFDSMGMKYETLQQAEQLTNLYTKAGMYKVANNIMTFSKKLSDSLMSVEKQVAVHELEEKYHSEKKELENKALRSELTYKKTVNILLMVFLIIMGVLVYTLRQRNYYQQERNRSYEVLIEKYREEKKNREKKATGSNYNKIIDHKTEVNLPDVNEQLFKRLSEYYVSEKPYINPKLKIEEIALYLNVNNKDLQLCLRLNGSRNFNAFTNKYRVQEIRQMLEDPQYDTLKLDAIAIKGGFATKPPFYAAFEEETGMKPGYYRSRINEQQG
jgi:AraC-like DNA-binding protein